MKWISFILILSALLLAGCREKQVADTRETPAINIKKVTRLEPDIQIRPKVEPGTTDFITIKTKADITDDVDEFVTWLKTRTNVSNVVHSKMTYLTSNPPKQVVSFYLDGVSHRLVFTIDNNKAFKLL
jgi:PBP1b-binding outer membrane lipoprotein LpoB